MLLHLDLLWMNEWILFLFSTRTIVMRTHVEWEKSRILLLNVGLSKLRIIFAIFKLWRKIGQGFRVQPWGRKFLHNLSNNWQGRWMTGMLLMNGKNWPLQWPVLLVSYWCLGMPSHIIIRIPALPRIQMSPEFLRLDSNIESKSSNNTSPRLTYISFIGGIPPQLQSPLMELISPQTEQ